MNNQPVRINKYLAERLGISRREADDLVYAGKVTVDGKVVALGAKVDGTQEVCCDGKVVPPEMKYTYVAFNKPIGYVCSRRAQGQVHTIYELLPEKYHQFKTVGRLDKNTSGIIILTNDGTFAFQMTHPKFYKTKTYEVELNHPLEPLHQQMISDHGVMLNDGVSKFQVIKDESRAPYYTVILTEGRNRQIRRTFAALGYQVVRLHRSKFGNFELSGLEPGKFEEIEIS